MSFNSFFADMPFRARLIGFSILLLPLALLFVLALLFLRPQPIQPELVLGCYTAGNAPWLKVEAGMILIGEKERRHFTYVAEPKKEGYVLTVSPAMALSRKPDGKYEFRVEQGIGYFWSLLGKSSDDPRDLRNPDDYGGRFVVVARDSQDIVYMRSSAAESCR